MASVEGRYAVNATNPAAAPTQPTEAHLRDYWNLVWKGRWTVLGIFLAVFGFIAAWTYLQTPIFRAVATVEIQPQARRLGPGQDVSGLGVSSYGWFAEERYQNTQIEIVRSRDVMGLAFTRLGLGDDERFRSSADPVAAFMGHIRVEPRRETALIEISTQGPDPEEAALWANAVAEAYEKRNFDRAKDNVQGSVDQIRAMLDPLRENLATAEEVKFEILEEEGILSPEKQQEVVKQRLTRLNAEYDDFQTKAVRLRSTLDKAQEILTSGGDASSLPDIAADAQVSDLRGQRIKLERDLDTARVTLRPGHPEFQALENNVEKLDRRIREQVSLVLSRLQNEYDLAARNASRLRAQIREAEDFADRVDRATSRFDVAKTDVQSKRLLFDAVTKTLNEISVATDLLSNNVRIIDPAVAPVRPIKPSKRLNLFLGAVMGLFLGVGAVFFLDYLDNTLHSPEDVERHAGINTLSVVPKYSLGETLPRAVREAYQTLRTGLIFSSHNRERKIVLVTSTTPQEGKSSTVANLARTLAGAGDRVLVLDCDLRRPTQHVHLKLAREQGLTTYLAGDKAVTDWEAFVQVVGPDSLHAIPCGPIPPNPPELLGGERFESLLREAANRYDWILIDSPPAISLADASVLCRLAQMTVVVIRHNKTDRGVVARSVQQLRQIGAEIAGAVLNSVDVSQAGKGDYYYAGYYYYADEERGQKSRKEKVAATVEPSA
jgi:capsular exopolysaccharide synthesis family protein